MTSLILLSVAYFICALSAASSFMAESVYLPVVYRPIYIPFAFWIFTALYAAAFRRVDPKRLSGRSLTGMTLLGGISLHLTLLLVQTYFSVAASSAAIGGLYKLYIEAVMYCLVFLSLFWGLRTLRRPTASRNALCDVFFLPVIYIFLYASFLAAGSKNLWALVLLFAIALVNLLIKIKGELTAPLGAIFVKASKALAPRRRTLFAIFLFAFFVRLIFGMGVVHKTQAAFPTASDDGSNYNILASRLAEEISFLRNADLTPKGFEPGYTFFLAIVYKIFGHSFYAAVLLQSLIGALVPLLIYLLAEVVTARRSVAAIAAAWGALDQPLIMMSCVLGQEALYIPILTGAVYLIVRYLREIRDNIAFFQDLSIGILLGLANVVRVAILYFAPVVLAYIFFIRTKKAFFRKAVDLALIVSFMALLILPVTYLNFLNTGRPILITAAKPITQWEDDPGTGYYFPGNTPLAKIGINPFKDMKGSLIALARHPLEFLAIEADLLPRRAVAFFFAYNFGFFDPIYMVNAANLSNRFSPNLEFYIALFVILGFCLVMARAPWRKISWPIFILIAYYAFLHVVVCRMGNIRYRAPIHPYLIIFGAVGIMALVDYIKGALARKTDG